MQDNYLLRRLHKDDSDIKRGYLKLLGNLTVVGNVDERDFRLHLLAMIVNPIYNIWVVEDTSCGEIVGTGTLLVEDKFIHNLGKVGHIEDIVVDPKHQGKNLGQKIIKKLLDDARLAGCYKVILNCSEKVEKFYEKCGFKRSGLEMRINIE